MTHSPTLADLAVEGIDLFLWCQSCQHHGIVPIAEAMARYGGGGFKFGRKHRSHALIEVVDGKDVQTIVRGGAGAN